MVQYEKQTVPARGGIPVRFSTPEPAGAGKTVYLTGSFNDWDGERLPLAPLPGEKGRLGTTLRLAPGYYEYKFIVDGQWLPDEENPNCAANDFGTLNSVLNVEE